jgi:hypothetical protein
MAVRPSQATLIDTQVSSWVDNLCRSYKIEEPGLIQACKNKVRQHILSRMEAEQLGMDNFSALLAEGLKMLNRQLEQSETAKAGSNDTH